jgi:hypothetical protein
VKPRNRQKHKGRRESGTFTLIPHPVQDSSNWHACSGNAIKLICELARQYNGRNNGDLCAALSMLKRRGWTRGETIMHAARELINYGLIELTRQGGLHKPNLYAITWQPIDECNGKLEVPATNVAPGTWRELRPVFKRPSKKTPCRKTMAAMPESGITSKEEALA